MRNVLTTLHLAARKFPLVLAVAAIAPHCLFAAEPFHLPDDWFSKSRGVVPVEELKKAIAAEDLTPNAGMMGTIIQNSSPKAIEDIRASIERRVDSGRGGDEATPLLIRLEHQLVTEREPIFEAVLQALEACEAGLPLKPGIPEILSYIRLDRASDMEVRQFSRFVPLLLSFRDNAAAVNSGYSLVRGLNRIKKLAEPSEGIPQAQILQTLNAQAEWENQHKSDLRHYRAARLLAASGSEAGNQLIASRLYDIASKKSDLLEFFDAMKEAFSLYRENPLPELLPEVIRVGYLSRERLSSTGYSKGFFASITEIGGALKRGRDTSGLERILGFLEEQTRSNDKDWSGYAEATLRKLK